MDEDKSIRCYWWKAVSRLRILSNSLEFGWGTFGELSSRVDMWAFYVVSLLGHLIKS